MSLSVNFKDAQLAGMALAKVGNSGRDEPLQTSQQTCQFQDEEAELLTANFLKSFKSLELNGLTHHSDLNNNELFTYATAIFDQNETLVENAAKIAGHLHAKSTHPNIKAGDLCVSLMEGIMCDGEVAQALIIVKSESKAPFLQVSMVEGDLKLMMQQGIYPDKMDKGCLIINAYREDGFVVYLYDKSGGSTQFWKRDFVGAAPIKDETYHTRRFAEVAVAFAEEGMSEEVKPEERVDVANRALSYLTEAENFDMDEFSQQALGEPDLIEKFETFRKDYQEDEEVELKDKFVVEKKEAKKAKKRLKAKLKLDVGVAMNFTSGFLDDSEKFLERGFDDDKHMNFVKVFFHREV